MDCDFCRPIKAEIAPKQDSLRIWNDRSAEAYADFNEAHRHVSACQNRYDAAKAAHYNDPNDRAKEHEYALAGNDLTSARQAADAAGKRMGEANQWKDDLVGAIERLSAPLFNHTCQP